LFSILEISASSMSNISIDIVRTTNIILIWTKIVGLTIKSPDFWYLMSIIQENTWYNILFWSFYEQDLAWLYFVCQAHLAITCRSFAMAVVYSLSRQLNASGFFVSFLRVNFWLLSGSWWVCIIHCSVYQVWKREIFCFC
jgi:hypothetical protein